MNTPPPPDRRFDADEFIAVVVALAAIGAILFWGLRRTNPTFSWNALETDVESDDGTRASMPFVTEPTPRATVTPGLAAVPPIVDDSDSEIVRSPRSNATVTPSPDAVSSPATPNSTTSVPEDRPTSSATAPTAEAPTPEISFPDVSTDYWAYPFIAGLAANGVVQGLQDGTFQPNAPTTRAQFASALQDAFDLGEYRSEIAFSDLSSDYWANDAIDASVKSAFMSGYPDNTFQPDQPISRLEMLLSLFSGLQLSPPDNPQEILSIYPDADDIPEYAVPAIAAATESELIVLPPGQTEFQPDATATRAEVASTLYQALALQGKVESVDSEAIVKP